MHISNKMIDTGVWQYDVQPKLPKSYNSYEKQLTIGFMYKGFKYLGELLVDIETGHVVWFVKPFYKDFNDSTIVISDMVTTSPYWKGDIYNTNFSNQKINNILKTFKEDSIFYSDDLTGTEFKKAIDFMIRR